MITNKELLLEKVTTDYENNLITDDLRGELYDIIEFAPNKETMINELVATHGEYAEQLATWMHEPKNFIVQWGDFQKPNNWETVAATGYEARQQFRDAFGYNHIKVQNVLYKGDVMNG